jgi:hypothetical protein
MNSMKIKKTVSEAKIAANKKSAMQSTGPKTPRGKERAKRNALKHRRFAEELLVLEEEKPEFEKHRKRLASHFNPSTPMLLDAFDLIVANGWRVKLALRYEQGRLKREFVVDGAAPQADDRAFDPQLVTWYGAGKREMTAGAKILDLAATENNERGELTDQTKQLLSQAFGPAFVGALTEWPSSAGEAVSMTKYVLARSMTDYLLFHSKTYKMPLDLPPPATFADPGLVQALRAKIIDERRSFLSEMTAIRQQMWSAVQSSTSRTGEFSSPYVSAAMRDYRRAVDWYMELEEQGL